MSPPDTGAVPDTPSMGTGLGVRTIRIFPVLGFISPALSSKPKSWAYYTVLALVNGDLLHTMLPKFEVMFVKAVLWLPRLMLN